MTGPTPAALTAFLAASVVLAVTPGPGVAYIVARTLAQGRRAGLASVAGVALGNLGNAAAAALGLAALLAVSPAAFTALKLLGAAYLAWLGLQALRAAPPPDGDAGATPDAAAATRLMRDGAWVALLNPKTALFFAAFLPQFLSPQGSAAVQSLVLGALFVAIAAATDSAWVLAAAAAAPWLARRRRAGGRAGRLASAAVYFGLAAWAAVSSPPAARGLSATP